MADLIDLAKALDTASHTMLLKSLENIGFRGVSLNLMTSYLIGRTQRVKINDVLSSVWSASRHSIRSYTF